MEGATDGGAYIEALRSDRMKAGHCELQADGCQRFARHLEFHHVSYSPERGLHLCHHCHHLVHFMPWLLTDRQKDVMLAMKHGPVQWLEIIKKPETLAGLRKNFIAPGRRPAQLALRQRLNEQRMIAPRRGPESRREAGPRRRLQHSKNQPTTL